MEPARDYRYSAGFTALANGSSAQGRTIFVRIAIHRHLPLPWRGPPSAREAGLGQKDGRSDALPAALRHQLVRKSPFPTGTTSKPASRKGSRLLRALARR